MFTTAVRVERDLGVPSVSFNTLTGHRSCTPEDCSELVANSPQGPVPVSGVFPVGAIFHLLETRLQAVWLSPCRADPPARHPIRLGMDCRFPGMLLSPTTLSGPGQPSDPETSPLVSARCAGNTPVHLMAHRLLRGLRPTRGHQLTTSLPTYRIGDPKGRATTSGSHVHLTTVRRVRRPAPAPAASPQLRRSPSPWSPHRRNQPATELTPHTSEATRYTPTPIRQI
jgi:hypothetical protein